MNQSKDSRKELLDLRFGRKRPLHSGENWGKEEVEQLKWRFLEGYGISEMATIFGRTELAIVQKLKEMELFEQQCRLRGPNRKSIQERQCRCPSCIMSDCPNAGKEFCHAGGI